jgi:hypothetical protein
VISRPRSRNSHKCSDRRFVNDRICDLPSCPRCEPRFDSAWKRMLINNERYGKMPDVQAEQSVPPSLIKLWSCPFIHCPPSRSVERTCIGLDDWRLL